MLDFYLINDSQSIPGYPEQVKLEFVKGISLNVFTDLQSKSVVDLKFSYYSDFRWDFIFVKNVKSIITNNALFIENSSCIQFLEILNKAIDSKCGLIAYCD